MHTQVLIVGGGITGVGVARDLALRGVPCLLVERRDICAGASGANHGLLHSGARYVRSDPAAAVECREENALLKRMAPTASRTPAGSSSRSKATTSGTPPISPRTASAAGSPAGP